MARCTVVRECCIVEPVSSDRQAILSPYLTYNSAPQFEIFVFIIIEVCPSPPFNIIMSGVEVQFESHSVFRKRLGKIADQIPGTGATRKNLINYFVGTWKIELGVRSRKYDIASTHFIEYIGKPLSVKVPYGLTVRQRTSLLWLALTRPVHHHAVLGLHHPVSRRCAPRGLSGKFPLHLGLDNFKREHLSDRRGADRAKGEVLHGSRELYCAKLYSFPVCLRARGRKSAGVDGDFHQ